MTDLKHAAMIPLIGGELLASSESYGVDPEYILTYEAFGSNESHLLNYYKQHGKNIPYHVIDIDGKPQNLPKVDIISSVCPCAGLSRLSSSAGKGNPANDWMKISAKYVLGEVKPKVYWGENAPALATNSGKFVLDVLREIAEENGYNVSLYRTKSLLHGIPQIRERSFYFFWDKEHFGDKVPEFKYYNEPKTTVRKLLSENRSNSFMEPMNSTKPSENPYIRYFMEKKYPGKSYYDFVRALEEDYPKEYMFNAESHIYAEGGNTYTDDLKDFLKEHNCEKELIRVAKREEKLESGRGVMWKGSVIPLKHIGAYVGPLVYALAHPEEDRYLTPREAMILMGLPNDFEMVNTSYNQIVQNVPYSTALHMANEVKESLQGNRNMLGYNFMIQNNMKQMIEISESNVDVMELLG